MGLIISFLVDAGGSIPKRASEAENIFRKMAYDIITKRHLYRTTFSIFVDVHFFHNCEACFFLSEVRVNCFHIQRRYFDIF